MKTIGLDEARATKERAKAISALSRLAAVVEAAAGCRRSTGGASHRVRLGKDIIICIILCLIGVGIYQGSVIVSDASADRPKFRSS